MSTELVGARVEEGSVIDPRVTFERVKTILLPPVETEEKMTMEFLLGCLTFFGYSRDPEENILAIDYCEGYNGWGWYIWCDEYRDEGSIFISHDREPTADMLTLMPEMATSTSQLDLPVTAT